MAASKCSALPTLEDEEDDDVEGDDVEVGVPKIRSIFSVTLGIAGTAAAS